MSSPRRALTLALLVLASLVPAAPGRADHSDGIYELPAIAQWTKTQLNILVVPPNHGQIFNSDRGLLNGNDPNELTPFNSYLRAIEDSIREWKRGVDTFGSDTMKKLYDVRHYVIGRDSIPPNVLTNPDILMFTDETQASALGVAIRVVPCLVRTSKLMIQSFSYADMFNVMGQELGHCLGLQHVGSQGGIDPTSEQKHPEHDIMNGFYTHWVGDKGTHLHCLSNLDVLALEYVFTTRNPSVFPSGGPQKVTYMPVAAYGTTCEPPPADWRQMTVGGPPPVPAPAPGPNPSPSPTPSASPTPTPAPAPSSSPTPDPSPTPTQSPSAAPAEEASTSIDAPRDGSILTSRSLRSVSGSASALPEAAKVQVAIAKRTATGGCTWWVQRKQSFVSASCTSPKWNRATGTDRWELPIADAFPAGRYRALSRAVWPDGAETCCHRGENLIYFRLT